MQIASESCFKLNFAKDLCDEKELKLANSRPNAGDDRDLAAELDVMLRLVDENQHPNVNKLHEKTRDLNLLALNVKFFGYELARALASNLPIRRGLEAQKFGLKSKPSTQEDLESDWVAYWSAELKLPVIFHRKLWEFAFVLQAVFEGGHLRAGAKGLGFGCGHEPLPSYFASRDLQITVTDLETKRAQEAGWIDSHEHAASLAEAFKEELVEKGHFNRNVSFRYVDMNAIPADLKGFDFCWSICAFEHLGSIAKGLAFVENSLATLRPGGVSVHTTEFNFLNDNETIDDWVTVLFQRKHFIQLANRLRELGHSVSELDFDVGNKPLEQVH